MARGLVDAPPRRAGAAAFRAAGRCRAAPARRAAARRAAGRRGAARACERSRSGAWRRIVGRVSSSSASASSRLETSSTRHCRQPAVRLPFAPARARRAAVDVQRQQLGVLDHGHRVLDAGRDPDRARRRHDVAAVRRGDPDDAGAEIATWPQGWVCGTTRVSARRRCSLARTGRSRSACRGAASAGRRRGVGLGRHWRDLDRT